MSQKTVVELDLIGYSDVARTLEDQLGAEVVSKLEEQIQGFVAAGLAAVGAKREQLVLATAGDNAILAFRNPADAHRFAEAVHEATRVHNERRAAASAKRWFRIGIATGDLDEQPRVGGGREVAGTVIADAVRLEAAARPGQIVCDTATFKSFPADIQALYGTEEEVRGKRAERFRARRYTVVGYTAPVAHDRAKYLESLCEETGWINIRGLMVGTGQAQRVPIGELYIPLTTATDPAGAMERDEAERAGRMGPSGEHPRAPRRVELEDLLAWRRLVIVGDPGTGKTTFLYRIAFELSTAWLKGAAAAPTLTDELWETPIEDAGAGGSFVARLAAALRRPFTDDSPIRTGEGGTGRGRPAAEAPQDAARPFPILIRVAKLSEHIRRTRESPGYEGPASEDSPAWLLHFLRTLDAEQKWGLGAAFFDEELEQGSAIVLLDGLDEPPGRVEREAMARLFERATRAYDRCRFVVTTRPLAYVGNTVLDGFRPTRVAPLEPGDIDNFLRHWCNALFRQNPTKAEQHFGELTIALSSVPEIRPMARNPVMLTALAVVHWNERRLPEQRADLYQSILNWLARAREQRPGREPAARCLELLERLALAMQDSAQGRRVEVSKAEAAEILAPEFAGRSPAGQLKKGQEFLDEEEVDSGIIVSRGSDLRFWHPTFQEYLAAKAIAGFPDSELYALLLEAGKIYRADWREVALLLAGVLWGSGRRRVNALVTEVLRGLGQGASLADRAKCVGLLGAMIRQLAVFDYNPPDQYQQTLDSVLGIFEREKARGIDFTVRLEAAEALGQAGDPRLQEDNWITIKAGNFLMGAQKQKFYSEPNYDREVKHEELPVHEVHLDNFQIGRYPVTVEEYRKFVADEGYSNQRWWKAGGFDKTKEPKGWGWDEQVLHLNRPVVSVSWYEAAAYCAWLAARLPGVRLPTEAEWERAARGTSGRRYPWGNEKPDAERANYSEGSVGHATPVGLYPRGATSEGIDDLAGNVWEWVADWYGEDYYAKSTRENPKGPESGEVRVLRGGSWDVNPRGLRAALRYGFRPGFRDDDFGFRCVREG
jgi:formylglycine-generating enzyme required for sulfatase activity